MKTYRIYVVVAGVISVVGTMIGMSPPVEDVGRLSCSVLSVPKLNEGLFFLPKIALNPKALPLPRLDGLGL